MNDEDIKYRTLEHWRGIAALSVMVFHGFGAFRISSYPVHPNVIWLKGLADIGWFGVHIFFVISGYCIAANVYRLCRQNLGPWDFFRDRLLRIYPAYWVACLAGIAANFLAAPFNGVPLSANLPDDWRSTVANILLIEPYVGVDRLLLLVSWSLVYEIGFYAITAIGFGLYRLGLSFWLLLGGAVVLAVCGLIGWHHGALYVLKFWPEFVSGGLVFVALWLHMRSALLARALMLLPVLFGAIGGFALVGEEWRGETIGAAAFSLLLFWLHRWDSRLAAWPGLNWLSWVGTISYSLYLVHVPLGGRVVNFALRWIPPDSLWILPLQIAYWLLSILIAYLFFRICEHPFNDWRGRVKREALSLATARMARS